MSISNGFDTTKVLQALSGRIGWKQPIAAGFNLDNDNKKAVAGRYWSDFHAMVTIENIIDTAAEGNKMNEAQKNALLSDLQRSAILRAINGVFNKPQLIESTYIFERTLRNDNLVLNTRKFCGYRLIVAPGEFALQISRVSLMFTKDATFTLYLYQDMINEPLKTKEVTVKAYEEVAFDLEDWILTHDTSNSLGGTYYFGYYQAEINEQDGCRAIEQFVNKWNKTLAVGYTAFETPADFGDGTAPTFNRINIPYTFRPYGLNLEVQTYTDFTRKIVKNASLFDNAIGLAYAIQALEGISYTSRSNKTQRISQEMGSLIYNEVNNSGDALQLNPYVAGLKQQLAQELGRINRTFFRDGRINEVLTSRPPIYGIYKD